MARTRPTVGGTQCRFRLLDTDPVKHTPEYRASNDEVIQLLADQPMVRLITIDADGWPRVGLHVHVTHGLHVELHLANDDPQLADLRRTGRVVIEVDEVLSFSPSHWVDDENASHADQYFRCATLRGEPELVSDRSAIVEHLRALLMCRQPEGMYVRVDEGHPLYAGYLDRLTLVRLAPADVVSKFKVAQQVSADTRARIVQRLGEHESAVNRATRRVIEQSNER